MRALYTAAHIEQHIICIIGHLRSVSAYIGQSGFAARSSATYNALPRRAAQQCHVNVNRARLSRLKSPAEPLDLRTQNYYYTGRSIFLQGVPTGFTLQPCYPI